MVFYDDIVDIEDVIDLEEGLIKFDQMKRCTEVRDKESYDIYYEVFQFSCDNLIEWIKAVDCLYVDAVRKGIDDDYPPLFENFGIIVEDCVDTYTHIVSDESGADMFLDRVNGYALRDAMKKLVNTKSVQYDYPHLSKVVDQAFWMWDEGSRVFEQERLGYCERDERDEFDEDEFDELDAGDSDDKFDDNRKEEHLIREVNRLVSQMITVNGIEFYRCDEGYKTIWTYHGYSARANSDRRQMQALLVAICRANHKTSKEFAWYCDFNNHRNDKTNYEANRRREEDLEVLRTFEARGLLES